MCIHLWHSQIRNLVVPSYLLFNLELLDILGKVMLEFCAFLQLGEESILNGFNSKLSCNFLCIFFLFLIIFYICISVDLFVL